jgi:hypothetical protein
LVEHERYLFNNSDTIQTSRARHGFFTSGVKQMQISKEALELFLEYAKDAGNWNGTPLVGGNVNTGPKEKGYLTALKKAGLVKTETDGERIQCIWLYFTDAGKALALEHGIKLD